MNYVVLDLEWNQCPEGKRFENSMLPFEIIEIGAAKLNSSYFKISVFNELIKPCVYERMHFKTSQVTHVDMEELNKGRYFDEVAYDFLRWCGKDIVFCTWGTMDLSELQRNLEYFGVYYDFSFPLYYYDVQKLFSLYFEGEKRRRTLEYAIDYLELEKKYEFHRAVSDALYTAKIFARIQKSFSDRNMSVDYYRNPRSKKEEIFLINDDHSKFVSREFATKEKAMADREVVSTKCHICGKTLRKKIRWFSVNAKTYYCLATCEEHGFMRCKIRMKRNEDNLYYVIKTIRQADEEECRMILEKKEELRIKRRNRRHNKKAATC